MGDPHIVGIVDSGQSLSDTPRWPGCTYRYLISRNSSEILSQVDFAGTLKNPRTAWSSLDSKGYRIKRVSIDHAELRTTILHGVKIVIAFQPDAQQVLTKEMKDAFEWQCLNSFHRLYLLFGDFPLSEYRIIVTDTVQTIESLPGCTATLKLGRNVEQNASLSNEELSHQIGHAWIGGAIRDQEHRIDGWLTEGIDHFVGIAVLNSRVNYFNRDWKDRRYIAHANEPLAGMYQKYFGTPDSYSYYAKGAMLTGLILSELEKSGIDPLLFFRFLYQNYASVSLSNDNNEKSLISTNGLRSDIASMGKLDVEKIFDPYVYRDATITRTLVTYQLSSISTLWE